MDKTEIISELERCLSNYEKIQAHHLCQMQSETLPDLELMNTERAGAFRTLKAALDTFMGNAGTIYGSDSLSMLSGYEQIVSSMMELDEKIAIEIKKHKDRLKADLARMKKGKQAITGYKSTGTVLSSPKVVSMNR